MEGYDIIGDVHASANKLEGLLDKLGYRPLDGVRRHGDGRTAVFVGDLIDRGSPEDTCRVLDLVGAMAEEGSALVAMGNHEFNALAYATEHPDEPDRFLRNHTENNERGHAGFLAIDEARRRSYLEWFATLPLWLELDGVRVIHACWDAPSVALLGGVLTEARFTSTEQLVAATTKGHPVYEAVELILKGVEVPLEPHGIAAYLDKAGIARQRARLRWWLIGEDRAVHLLDINRDYKTLEGEPYPPIDEGIILELEADFHYDGGDPVVFGHYWKDWDSGLHLACTPRTACVDFSAVAGGPLVAYRFDLGDVGIDAGHYVESY